MADFMPLSKEELESCLRVAQAYFKSLRLASREASSEQLSEGTLRAGLRVIQLLKELENARERKVSFP